MRFLLSAASMAAVFLATPAIASADEPVVLAIDGNDIYVDLGARDGVGAGSELELLHEIVVRDPKNGSMLRDRFDLGTMTVAKSGTGVSVAHADAELAKRVLPGDHVRLVSAKRTFVDPWAEQVATSTGQTAPPIAAPPPGPPSQPIDHAELARTAWGDTLGQPIERRVTRWNELLAADPQTPYRKAIEGEIASLRAQAKAREAAIAKAKTTVTTRDPRIAQLSSELEVDPELVHGPLVVGSIARAVPGRPIELAFLARWPSTVRAAWLYVRPDGAPGFSRTVLHRDGDAYLRGTIDGTQVKGEKVEWYVEVATSPDQDATPVIGSQNLPRTIAVDEVVTEAPIEQGRTQIDAHMEFVDFDGKLDKGYDQYTQAELDFTYRFLKPVYAVRLGFGTLTGTGGPKDVIDLKNNCLDETNTYRCRRVTFSYVYTEVELRVRPNVAIMLRPQAGVLTTDTMDMTSGDRCKGSSDTSGCEFFTGVGARGRIRLGDELGTNLVLGASFTSRVGTLLEAAYHWLPNPVVPVQITVQVTDQPVVEDLGVRLIGDVGLRKLTWFYPSLRVSYQARDIDHSGISGGFALNFDW